VDHDFVPAINNVQFVLSC